MFSSDSPLFTERNRHVKTGNVKVQSGFGSAKTTFKTTLKTVPKRGPFSTLNVPIVSIGQAKVISESELVSVRTEPATLLVSISWSRYVHTPRTFQSIRIPSL